MDPEFLVLEEVLLGQELTFVVAQITKEACSISCLLPCSTSGMGLTGSERLSVCVVLMSAALLTKAFPR